VLLAIGAVDAVVLFDEDTPQRIIERIQPDVLVKGSDWGADAIVGREVVEARGGRVIRVDLAAGYSTTELLRRAQTRNG
jgi:bifunctional ADP-heptose synthase (sugar kinase/adenylyltransferase)